MKTMRVGDGPAWHGKGEEDGEGDDNLEDAAARAQEAQPKGTTFETANVQTKVPIA